MGETTHRGKNNRVYVRKFDYDEARALYDAGAPVGEIAAEFGVSKAQIWLALNPESRAHQRAYAKEWGKATCGDCGGPAQRINYRGPYPRCVKCAAKKNATTVRPDTLWCWRCERWMPDEAFPRNRTNKSRRGRHQLCTGCNTAVRRDYRERNKVPCDRCGRPRLPGKEKGGRVRDTGLCLNCWRTRASWQ